MDCSPPGSSVHNVFQGRILQQVAISYPREVIFPTQGSIYPSSPGSPALAGRVFISEPPGKHRPAARIYLILARGGRQGDCCQVGGGGGRSPSWCPLPSQEFSPSVPQKPSRNKIIREQTNAWGYKCTCPNTVTELQHHLQTREWGCRFSWNCRLFKGHLF